MGCAHGGEDSLRIEVVTLATLARHGVEDAYDGVGNRRISECVQHGRRRICIAGGHIDGDEAVGGENGGFRPMQLVLAAVAPKLSKAASLFRINIAWATAASSFARTIFRSSYWAVLSAHCLVRSARIFSSSAFGTRGTEAAPPRASKMRATAPIATSWQGSRRAARARAAPSTARGPPRPSFTSRSRRT